MAIPNESRSRYLWYFFSFLALLVRKMKSHGARAWMLSGGRSRECLIPDQRGPQFLIAVFVFFGNHVMFDKNATEYKQLEQKVLADPSVYAIQGVRQALFTYHKLKCNIWTCACTCTNIEQYFQRYLVLQLCCNFWDRLGYSHFRNRASQLGRVHSLANKCMLQWLVQFSADLKWEEKPYTTHGFKQIQRPYLLAQATSSNFKV